MRRVQPVRSKVMIIDRMEGNMAVVETAKGEHIDVPLTLIDGRARDGAVLVGRYTVDEQATGARTRDLAERRRRLFSKR